MWMFDTNPRLFDFKAHFFPLPSHFAFPIPENGVYGP